MVIELVCCMKRGGNELKCGSKSAHLFRTEKGLNEAKPIAVSNTSVAKPRVR